ncbi:DUF309 domain-containing protein [Hazenella sp. IB182357]|uniref:DUF309 domain-containing protein n=1 Tax=Polycladospora coralii TaxID=2771432 RepID=A0A926NA64_9BACL|nr:DUF309 domain-containing protein [Polycladospora coralii]
MDYPQLYVDFIYYFNVERDFYTCHDVLEELWLEEGRDPFFQGLLQVAVGFYHLENENRRGAIKSMTAGLDKLMNSTEAVKMGIHLERLKKDVRRALLHLDDNISINIKIIDLELERLVLRR